jgi:CRISPR/Cas system-associated protein Csx1
MKNMIKQNLIEVHTNQGRKGIAKVMNTRGQYIYVINSSELSYSLFDVEKTTFYSWNQAWEYFKKTTENWQSFLPTLINGDIKNIIKHELKECIYDFSIAQYQSWKKECLPLWESCLREEIYGTSQEEWMKRAS